MPAYHCTFDYDFYKKKLMLPMGSPLSSISAFLFLEFIETGSFPNIVLCNNQRISNMLMMLN